MKDVYSLSDLKSGNIPANAKFAVIGWPINHSVSPQMHQALLDARGMDVSYIRVEVEPGRVAEAFELMRRNGFIGCNVTIPHKVEALEACDSLTATAEAMGVVNTLHFKTAETLGHNTDGLGLLRALKEEMDVDISSAKVLLLGAGGGAGRAIATQFAMSGCDSLYLSNRTVSKVVELKQELTDGLFDSSDLTIVAIGHTEAEYAEIADEVDLIINASSCGMKEEDGSPFPVELLQKKHRVYDAIYSPPETVLLKATKAVGGKTANGLSMLVHQGALAFELWMGADADAKVMRSGIC